MSPQPRTDDEDGMFGADGIDGTALVDAHHHVWWQERTPWLSGPIAPRIFGEYAAIRRDYLIDEYAADVRPSGVRKSVHVQVNLAPEQATWEVSAAAAAGATRALVQGVVAQADLRSPTLGDDLDALLAAGPVRGVRQQLHWHERPQYRFAATATEMLDPGWQTGLQALAERGLLFEAQVFPSQLRDLTHVIAEHPGVTFVLLHAGMPEDRSDQAMAYWHNRMADLATHENVAVKLSGLGTFTRSCTVAGWAPVVRATVDLFGPARCMFGSNFPIERMWTTYGDLVGVMTESLAPYSTSERRHVWASTCERLYRI